MNKQLIIFLLAATGALSYFLPLGSLYIGNSRRNLPISIEIYDMGWTAIVGSLCFLAIAIMTLVNLIGSLTIFAKMKIIILYTLLNFSCESKVASPKFY